MEGIEYNTWILQQEYWALKYENALLEKELIELKLTKERNNE